MSNKLKTCFASSQHAPLYADLGDGSVAMYSAASPNKRRVNEDAYAVLPVGADSTVLVVADGAGGHPNGDVAARLAIESVVAELSDMTEEPSREVILRGFERGQQQILEQVPGAASTLVVVEIKNQTLNIFHVGDSGARVVGGRGKQKVQTMFHSPTGYAVAAGILSEVDAMRHEMRHVVSNMMGAQDMSVEIGKPIEIAPRDTLVVASDGLFDNLLSNEIAERACRGSLNEACSALIETATLRMLLPREGEPSKPDDLTVLMYRRNRQ